MIKIPYLLELAKRAALRAGEVILDVYTSKDFAVNIKSDQSPLTGADIAAHKIIVSCLKESHLPCLSEEGSHVKYVDRKSWEWFWLIDPLDGTKEFIERNGQFTVNISLIHGNIPAAGVVYAPYICNLYYGSEETGVFKIEKNEPVQLSFLPQKRTVKELQQKEQITIVTSKSHMNQETKAFVNQFRNANLLSLGSSLKLMLLAEGKADIYPRMSPTMEWDTAAAHALLRSLNMGVYQTDLRTELKYNKKELLNPSFIAI